MADDAASDGSPEGHASTEDPQLEGAAELPPNLSVRVSNIDKMATDDDLLVHFSGPAPGPSGVRSVEKFVNPKHTARLDLEDEASLQRAMGLDGSMLHRRPLKVEPWDDRIFENMSALERKFASASKPVGRPKLMIKPRTKPVPQAEGERPAAGPGAKISDPFAGAPLQRQRRPVGEPPARADSDEDWRRRPAEAEVPGSGGGVWAFLARCCKRRPPD